jgi:hypothetical protein
MNSWRAFNGEGNPAVRAALQGNGVPIIPAHCLIPLKARAWLDLGARKSRGDDTVKSNDIKKHRNDVFSLSRSLAQTDRFALPNPVQADLRAFLERFPPDSPDWPAIHQAVGKPELPDPSTILARLSANFDITVEAGS